MCHEPDGRDKNKLRAKLEGQEMTKGEGHRQETGRLVFPDRRQGAQGRTPEDRRTRGRRTCLAKDEDKSKVDVLNRKSEDSRVKR